MQFWIKISVVASLAFWLTLGCVDNEREVEIDVLVDVYCGNCHMTPSPALLPRAIWEGTVLPRMGYFYGIYSDLSERNALIESNRGGEIVESAEVFPEEPIIESRDWERIVNHYVDNAPDTLNVQVPSVVVSEKFFRPNYPSSFLSPPGTTLAQFDAKGNVYIGDANKGQLFKFNNTHDLLSRANVREGAVHVEELEDGLWVTVMGSFSPTDAPDGFIARLPRVPGEATTIVIPDLQRPVHTSYGDLHGDGRTDIVVSEFGKWTGGLSLFHNKGEDGFEKVILRNTPGATRAYIKDMNGDRRADIIALFAQGDEGIDIFYNQGDSKFQRNRVLSFDPAYGSSFFDLFDWNGDGYLDIIYTAGDNADYSPILKPYHGIYIYLNDGKNQFELHHFEPLNGAYKAIPADFDGDGLMDLAAISFFPDWEHNPKESFLLLLNTGGSDLAFERTTIPGFDKGRWITMDCADMDSDGDLDLVLGSLAFEVIPDQGEVDAWVANGIGYVILENLQK